jgi:NAD(P)-dependent dehydrogenase (short-subunit alcohol dehydrogenase family)
VRKVFAAREPTRAERSAWFRHVDRRNASFSRSTHSIRRRMTHALIQGASRGIGRAMVVERLSRGDRVTATCRRPSDLHDLVHPALVVIALDLEDDASIAAAAEAVNLPVDVLVNVSGLLHDGELQPEKRLGHNEAATLHRLFQVNAIGPLLVAKHFERKLSDKAVFASLSARVGSIADNRLGGWYGYRASKAAQNMFMKTLSIEWARRWPDRAVVSLHPGTVETDLSAPFRRHAATVFSVERAAEQLLGIVDGLTGADTGRFMAWDGSDIPY